VVALHGCGGPFPSRDGSWAETLAKSGHIVLLPDSFGSRGLGSQCRNRQREATPSGERRADAIAAAQWLAQRPDTPPGGIALIGWSNGGSTVLAAARRTPDLPAGLFRGFVASYPGCVPALHSRSWQPAGKLLILIGANDDWTPAAPCRELAAKFPRDITLQVYPDAWHDFDAPNEPIRERSGLASTANGSGVAHAGTNPAARQDALRRVPEFLDQLP
jgi:dienelactone hydrolase